MDSSGLTLNRSTFEERANKLYYLRFLYFLVALSLLFGLLVHYLASLWPGLHSFLLDSKWVGIVAGLLCLCLILACYFVPLLARGPINWLVYALFTFFFAIFVAWVLVRDTSKLAHFIVWLLFLVTLAFGFFFLTASFYPSSLTSALLILGIGAMVLFAFLAFTQVEPWKLAVAFLVGTVFAFMISYQQRSMVRNALWDLDREEPVTGAVRIWLDGLLGLCRGAEMFSKGFGKLPF